MKLVKSLVLAWVVAGLMGIAVTGCHTVRGVGQDLEHGGKAIERAADNAQGR